MLESDLIKFFLKVVKQLQDKDLGSRQRFRLTSRDLFGSVCLPFKTCEDQTS